MSTPTVLPPLTAGRLVAAPSTGSPRAVRAAVARAVLMLVPLAAALAASDSLAPLPWYVPAAALAAGWCAAAPLVHLGSRAAAESGAGAAARLVLSGYLVLAAIGTLVLLGTLVVLGILAVLGTGGPLAVPVPVAGAHLLKAWCAGAVALALFAVLAVATATGAEAPLLRWSLPAVVGTGAVLAGWLPLGGRTAPATGVLPPPFDGTLPVPGEPVLLAAFALPLGRAAALARRPPTADHAPVDRGDLPQVAAWLLLGAAQVAAVVTAWRVGVAPTGPETVDTAGAVPTTVAPVLLALPLVEACAHRRPATRPRGGVTAYALGLPLLGCLAVLTATTGALTPDTPAQLGLDSPTFAGLTAGVLLTGLWVAAALLVAHQQPVRAAALVGAPVPVTLALVAAAPLLAGGSPGWGQPLPAFLLGCAAACLAAAVAAAVRTVSTLSRETLSAETTLSGKTLSEEAPP